MQVVVRGDSLLITQLPLEDMALLAAAIPLGQTRRQVLTALLEGRRVGLLEGAAEYKRYRRTAPLEVYRRFTAMERQLRELGLVRVREEERETWS